MSLQAARQLLQELEVPTPPPTDCTRVCQVLKGMLESHQHIAEQARKFNEEAQAAMDLKLSFDGFAGGGSGRPVSFGSNIDTYGHLQHQNHQLRHRLRVVTSTWFHYEVYQHFRLDDRRVFFTPNAELSASCNALVRENKQLMDRLRIAETAVQTAGSAAQQVAHLQQQVDEASRVARGRILEDLQTRQHMEGLNLHNHNMVQKVNFLAHSNWELTQSVTALQQQLGQQLDQRPLQQAGDDAAGLTAGFGQPAHESHVISGTTKITAQATPKPPSSTGTGFGDDGGQACGPATPADAISSGAASQSQRGAAFPSLSRLTAPNFSNPHAPGVAQETDSGAEVVAAVLAADDKPPALCAAHPVAEALPLPGPDESFLPTHHEEAQQPSLDADQHVTTPDAPAVPSAAYVSWGGLSGNHGDCGGDGWSEDDDAADKGPAAAPAASKPSTFLEAACRGVIAREVPIPPAEKVTTASLSRSAKNASAVLRRVSRTASGVYAAQSQLPAAKRPQTVAADGWHEVMTKRGSKSAKHVNTGGKDMHNTAQPAVSRGLAHVRSDVEQATGGAAKLTSTQKKRRAKLRRKAVQQSGMQLRS